MGLPGGSGVKNPPGNARDVCSIPGSGRSPGEGNGNPFNIFACLTTEVVKHEMMGVMVDSLQR